MTRRFVKEAEIERARARHTKLIEHGCVVDDLVALAASGKRFATILADPPLPFDGAVADERADHHYPTPARSKRSWTCRSRRSPPTTARCCCGPHRRTSPSPANQDIEAWGFRPSTVAFVWVKQNKTDGRVRTRGQSTGPSAPANTCLSDQRLADAPRSNIRQVVMAPVGEHSEKPEEVRRRIERLFAGPYLELYARRPAAGWTVWGNDEIPRAEFAAADHGGGRMNAAQPSK